MEENYDEILKDLKYIFRDINKQNIKKIIFKENNPTEDEVKEIFYYLSDKPKLFVVRIIKKAFTTKKLDFLLNYILLYLHLIHILKYFNAIIKID